MTFWWTNPGGAAGALGDTAHDTPGHPGLVGLWDFGAGAESADTALADGVAQNGHFHGNAQAVDGALVLDGSCDYFDVNGDDMTGFDLDRGMVEVEFSLSSLCSDYSTIVNRGEFEDRDDEGWFVIRVTDSGKVEVRHHAGGDYVKMYTSSDFVSAGDEVRVLYSWDIDSGATFIVENVTTGAAHTASKDQTGLTMDIGDDDDENWTFGAREYDDGCYDDYAQGQINYVAVYDDIYTASGDGYVQGTENADLIDTDYLGDPHGDLVDAGDALLAGEAPDDDIILAGDGDDTVLAGEGDDDIYAGGGADSVEGGAGNDRIWGDSDLGAGVSSVRESFEWDLGPSTGDINGFSQNTGNTTVTYKLVSQTSNATTNFSDVAQNTSDIDGGDETVDDTSSLRSYLTGKDNSAKYELAFADAVENVNFRVNDIDGDGIVSIKAFDAAGDPIPVTISGGSKLTLKDLDGIAGNETADSQGDYDTPASDPYSMLVNIAGPVARIVIDHSEDGPQNSGIYVTDVFFDVPVDPTSGTGVPGNDTLSGGDGEDMIFGEAGDDLLSGGADADTIEGGAGADTILGGSAGDVVDGGSDGDDRDTLDLRGLGPLRIVGETVDADGDSTSGTVEFLDADDNVTGSMTFAEIETILLDDPNTDPVANADDVETDEDTAVVIDVLGNDTDADGDTLSVTGAGDGANGTTTENPDGTITYTPNADFNGTDSFTYTITDGNGGTSEAVVTVEVLPINDDPVAEDDAIETDQGEAVVIPVLGNDTDVDGDPLRITSLGIGANGTTSLNPDGTVTYTPNPGFAGEDTFTYTVSDGNGGTDEATVTVTVIAPEQPPVAVDDAFEADQNETVGDVDGNVLANDSDPNGDPITVVAVAGVAAGVGTAVAGSDGGFFTIAEDGTIDFDANGDFDGLAESEMAQTSVTYSISDGKGGTDQATVTFTVTGTNDGPVAVDDSAKTALETPVVIDVLANDSDPDGDPLTVLTATSPDGTVDINPDGTLTFTPAPGVAGDATINYTIEDPLGETASAVVTVSVLDGIVQGTAAGDLIDVNYTGDPQGDMVDAGDAILPGEGPDDDIIEAGDGNDTVFAGEGSDEVDGGAGDDEIYGEAGDDELLGRQGDDYIDGGEGDDSIGGQSGKDTLIGGAGEDTLRGGAEDDVLDGGADDDSVSGGAGDDDLAGGLGDDTLDGGDGQDTIVGGDGADVIRAESGNAALDHETFVGVPVDGDTDNDRDLVDGGAGNDTITTGDDADTIFGGTGDDSIDSGIDDDDVDGGDGDDYIDAGLGADSVLGGEGDDTIIAGVDAFSDYEGDDPNLPNPALIDPSTGQPATSDPNENDGKDTVDGGAGNDSIITGDDDDLIFGGTGNDTIDAGIDDDEVYGGDGDDSIIGGHGSDYIEGGAGNDTINAGDSSLLWGQATDDVDPVPDNGKDTVSGGDGDDVIYGEDDADDLSGDAGNDYIDGGIDDDKLRGGTGEDTLIGGQGDDDIDGDEGADLIDGGEGADSIDGGDGNDTIIGGGGADVLKGQDDRDTFKGITQDTVLVDGGEGVSTGDSADDFDTLNLAGAAEASNPGGSLQIVYDSGNPENGEVFFFDADGNQTGVVEFKNIENVVPCFTPGTLIATPRGERRVEELRVGDKIITRDNGIQEIRWMGCKPLYRRDLMAAPHLKPILIRAGSLGNGLPERDLMVSPNHRILASNEQTTLYFEEHEVLASAKHLTGVEGVNQVEVMGLTYIHFMFDQHEVVLSNGAWTESFQPGDYTLNGIGNAQRNEIFELFPELQQPEGIASYQAARRSLKKHEAALLFR